MASMAFFTAEELSDRTTWGRIQHFKEFDEHPCNNRKRSIVLGKYDDQVKVAFRNASAWNSGARWEVDVTELNGSTVKCQENTFPAIALRQPKLVPNVV